MRPEGSRKIFLRPPPPLPLLSQSLDDRPPPPPPLSASLDPPLGAMGPILPAQVANHNTVFALFCLLAISAM